MGKVKPSIEQIKKIQKDMKNTETKVTNQPIMPTDVSYIQLQNAVKLLSEEVAYYRKMFNNSLDYIDNVARNLDANRKALREAAENEAPMSRTRINNIQNNQPAAEPVKQEDNKKKKKSK